MSKVSMADILELSVSERIRLVGDIRDSITAHPGTVTLTEAQQDELDQRLEDCWLNPDDAEPWKKVNTPTA